ncbi:MAG: acyl-CoA thioesterase [Elusimicrobia bacterium]|nr:acyl-CoA thioesterase [Elusimicrobiota bacterium]
MSSVDLSKYKVHLDVQVRFRDTDAMGHVNNAVYLSYLELVRMKYWEVLSGVKDFSRADFILVHVDIDYRSPVRVGEEIRIYVRASGLGRSSWEFEYKIVEQGTGRLVVEARSVQCCYDYEKNKVKRMEDSFKRKMAEFDELSVT